MKKNEAETTDNPVKQRRGLSQELQACARIDKIMAELEPGVDELVFGWFVHKFGQKPIPLRRLPEVGDDRPQS